jgi:hypothetical protein
MKAWEKLGPKAKKAIKYGVPIGGSLTVLGVIGGICGYAIWNDMQNKAIGDVNTTLDQAAHIVTDAQTTLDKAVSTVGEEAVVGIATGTVDLEAAKGTIISMVKSTDIVILDLYAAKIKIYEGKWQSANALMIDAVNRMQASVPTKLIGALVGGPIGWFTTAVQNTYDIQALQIAVTNAQTTLDTVIKQLDALKMDKKQFEAKKTAREAYFLSLVNTKPVEAVVAEIKSNADAAVTAVKTKYAASN